MTAVSYSRLAFLTTALALCVVVLGAYVRLSHAGLSCPDWPGCYGQLTVPQGEREVATANESYPERPVDAPRAWKEMIHRYLAGVLGLCILALAVLAWRRRHMPGQAVVLPWILLALVIVQALMGMWTVTLKLKPIVVTAHLLGGMTTLALLWWLSLRQGHLFMRSKVLARPTAGRVHEKWLAVAIVLLVVQIALGGWTSANYAALACTDFPRCHGSWVPDLSLGEALKPWHGVGRDYEGGHLDNAARVTIHFLHRLGALVVFVYFLVLAIRLLRTRKETGLSHGGAALVLAVCLQAALGVSNVVFYLPLAVAVAHNAMAALLLLTTLTVYHMARPPERVSV